MIELFAIFPIAAAAVLSIAIGRDRWKYVPYVAIAGSIATLAAAIYLLFNNPGTWSAIWFSAGALSFTLTTVAGPMNMLLVLLVAAITPLILVYSKGYIRLPSEQGRYYFQICAFASAMLLFAMAGDLITMFIGWEILGLTSYLLIGFWRQRGAAVDAGTKAITTIFIGDMMMLGGIVLLWLSYHTFAFSAIVASTSHPAIAYVAVALIILAAFTKSAQFPFHEWLADAMEGPTPVSAFLHSSTMVKAGVFLLAVLLPLISAFNLRFVLITVGAVSAVVGALNAVSETHLKRILAYSTIEDLGLMVLALGFNSIPAAMMLFVVQTFYKAQLFMDAGYVMRANGDNPDIRSLSGPLGYKRLLIPEAIGAASLAGIFPLSGFFGKAAVDAVAPNLTLYVLLTAVSALSSFYIFRWLLAPLRNGKRTASYSMQPFSMLLPIYILSVLIVLASAAYILVPQYLGYSYGLQISATHAVVITVVAAAGAALAYLAYARAPSKARLPSIAGRIYAVVYTRPLTNAAYGYVVSAVNYLAEAADSFEYWAYAFISAGAHGFGELGRLVSRIENGRLDYYMAGFIIGIAVIFAVMVVL